jgi:Zn-finger nucleic acid-binding protein
MWRDRHPSQNENEYFIRRDAEWLEARRAELDAERAAEERRRHFMKCPKCGANLAERKIHRVRFDQCGECGGVWLDWAELEMVSHISPESVRGVLAALSRGIPPAARAAERHDR